MPSRTDQQQLGSIDLGCRLAAYFERRVGSGQRCCWPLNADPLGSRQGGGQVQILDLSDVGLNHEYQWPGGNVEHYDHFVEYRAIAQDGMHVIRLGFGNRSTYGSDRVRVVVWIEERPQAEFLGADDHASSGDVLAELKVPGEKAQRICRYPEEAVPERYSGFPVVGLPTRVAASGVHNAWAVVVNIADHKTMCALAALRRLERLPPVNT